MNRLDFLKTIGMAAVGAGISLTHLPEDALASLIPQEGKEQFPQLVEAEITRYVQMFNNLKPKNQEAILSALARFSKKKSRSTQVAYDIISLVDVPEILASEHEMPESGYKYSSSKSAILYRPYENELIFRQFLHGKEETIKARAHERLHAAFARTDPWKPLKAFDKKYATATTDGNSEQIDFKNDLARKEFSRQFCQMDDMAAEEAASLFVQSAEKFKRELPSRGIVTETIAYLSLEDYLTSDDLSTQFNSNQVYRDMFVRTFSRNEFNQVYRATIEGIGIATTGKSMARELVRFSETASKNASTIYDYLILVEKMKAESNVHDAYERGIAWENKLYEDLNPVCAKAVALIESYPASAFQKNEKRHK